MPLRDGDVIAGKYRVDRPLGSGGMGVVVAATHLHLQEPVALKLLHPEAVGHPEAMSRFMREARAAAKLKSEHVARVLDVGLLDSGAPYMVMELLVGMDLAALLKSRGAVSIEEAADFVLQACDALAEAHALGIVHRDVKAANLFLTRRPDGTASVKVLDFGISKANAFLEPGGIQTKTATLMGSPLYMAPEQMRSARAVDGRADIWSLGVVLYELAVGRVPFRANGLGALLTMVQAERPASMRAQNPGVPPTFEAIVMRCLEKEPAARFANVAELARALAPYAPMRTRPLADRIAAVLGQPVAAASVVSPFAATSYDSHGSSRPPLPPHMTSHPSFPPASRSSTNPPASTGSPWAKSQARPQRNLAGPVALLAVWIVLGIAGAIGYAAFRRQHSSPSAAVAPPPSAELPAASSIKRAFEDAAAR